MRAAATLVAANGDHRNKLIKNAGSYSTRDEHSLDIMHSQNVHCYRLTLAVHLTPG